jgi:hypothetical protein
MPQNRRCRILSMESTTFLDADKEQRLTLFREDTWGLLGVIQASFGVEFATEDLVAADTLVRLAECVLKKLAHPPSERCLTALTFYRLRRAAIEVLETSRTAIRPVTPLAELFDWSSRKSRWRSVGEHSGLILPKLRYPAWMVGVTLVVAGVAVASILPRWIKAFADLGFLGVIGTFLTWALVLRLLSPFARAFGRNCRTFGDLVRFCLARNYQQIAAECGGTSQGEVLLALRYLIAVEVGRDVSEVRPETRFPEDLNIY